MIGGAEWIIIYSLNLIFGERRIMLRNHRGGPFRSWKGRSRTITLEQEMRSMKHKLELDALTVESFAAAPPPGGEDELFAPSAIDFTACATNCSCPPHW